MSLRETLSAAGIIELGVFQGRVMQTERNPFFRLERSGSPKTARRGDCFAVHFWGLSQREAADCMEAAHRELAASPQASLHPAFPL